MVQIDTGIVRGSRWAAAEWKAENRWSPYMCISLWTTLLVAWKASCHFGISFISTAFSMFSYLPRGVFPSWVLNVGNSLFSSSSSNILKLLCWDGIRNTEGIFHFQNYGFRLSLNLGGNNRLICMLIKKKKKKSNKVKEKHNIREIDNPITHEAVTICTKLGPDHWDVSMSQDSSLICYFMAIIFTDKENKG